MEQLNLTAAKPANFVRSPNSIRLASRQLLNATKATNKIGSNSSLQPITNEAFGLIQLIFSV